MPEASHCTEAKGPTIVPYRLSFKVLQERAEEPQAGANPGSGMWHGDNEGSEGLSAEPPPVHRVFWDDSLLCCSSLM